MRKIWLPIVLLLAAGGIFAITEAGQDYMTIQLVAPEGDPSAGRAAFLELSCTSCHAVAGDRELPAPISANPGPTLGPIQAAHARADAGSIASSIVSPSHVVVEELGAEVRQRLSPMGDFSDAMTVRQLVDLVAYLAEGSETDP
ncbi:MAG: c-type cytochrome [Thermoanaerobaculia bacterium]|nr:c-type cytochrome [Thermoanaerobaculia bacterium]